MCIVHDYASGVPCKVPCDRNILLISAHAIIINRIFASKCYYVSATSGSMMTKTGKRGEGFAGGGIGQQRSATVK